MSIYNHAGLKFTQGAGLHYRQVIVLLGGQGYVLVSYTSASVSVWSNPVSSSLSGVRAAALAGPGTKRLYVQEYNEMDGTQM